MADIRLRAGWRSPLLNIEDYRRTSQRALPKPVWAYVEGGAQDERTVRDNRDGFARWRLRPRVLCGSVNHDLAVTVADVPLELPVILSPVGLAGLVHPIGELGAAREAERHGTRSILSNAASYAMSDIEAGTAENHWFQLYPYYNHQFMSSVMDNAAKHGFSVLVVTLDVQSYGNRETEVRSGMGVPLTITPARILDAARRPRWCYGFVKEKRFTMPNLVNDRGVQGAVNAAKALHEKLLPNLSWDDLAWIREYWKGPLFVKGVLDSDDAARCVGLGVDGVIVSNHGGRQLDGVAAAVDALPSIADRIGGQAQIILDGGVRRGSDVIKALSLGADACSIGRPFLYGLAARGEAGVGEVLRILRDEIERDLTLMGCQGVHQLDRSWIQPAVTAESPSSDSAVAPV